MREEFPKSGENALNPEVSVEAGTEPPKKKVDSNVHVEFVETSCWRVRRCSSTGTRIAKLLIHYLLSVLPLAL